MHIKFWNGRISQNKKIVWIPATVISFSYICGCIGFDGISIVLAFYLWFLVGIEIFRKKYKITPGFVIIVLCILLLFVISYFRVPDIQYTFDYLQRFLLYDVLAFIVGMQNMNEEGVFKGVTIIGIVLLPCLLMKDFFAKGSPYAMGASYMCLPILIASILVFTIDCSIKYKIMSGANILGILFKYARAANRGIWVILATFAFMMFYLHIVRKGNRGFRKIKAFLFLLIISFVVIYGLRNIDAITDWLYNTIDRIFHIQVYALWKLQFYLGKGDVTNGRSELFAMSYECFKQHPIIGGGIGHIEIYAGTYMHNILLQPMCEGGILLLLPVLWILLCVLGDIFIHPLKTNILKEGYTWFVFVFCCGIEMLLFSSVYWLYLQFWFFLGSYLSKKKLYRSGTV